MNPAKLPPPPVPQRLRDMLEKYPGHIERLEEVLADFAVTPSGSDPFDRFISTLEGRLESFFFEAGRELEQAESTCDVARISAAEHKMDVMSRAISKMVWVGDEAIRIYIDKYRDEFP